MKKLTEDQTYLLLEEGQLYFFAEEDVVYLNLPLWYKVRKGDNGNMSILKRYTKDNLPDQLVEVLQDHKKPKTSEKHPGFDKYEIHIGEVYDMDLKTERPAQILIITPEQREVIETFANTRIDQNLNTIYIINDIDFRILPSFIKD
jgi:hypothetical protein